MWTCIFISFMSWFELLIRDVKILAMNFHAYWLCEEFSDASWFLARNTLHVLGCQVYCSHMISTHLWIHGYLLIYMIPQWFLNDTQSCSIQNDMQILNKLNITIQSSPNQLQKFKYFCAYFDPCVGFFGIYFIPNVLCDHNLGSEQFA